MVPPPCGMIQRIFGNFANVPFHSMLWTARVVSSTSSVMPAG